MTNRQNVLFGRLGNKTNDIKYFKEYLPMDVKNVIEPFGGSFALCRIIYNDDKYNKFVNDTDKDLYEIYKNPLEYSNYSKKMNNYAIENLNDNKLVDFKKFMKDIENDKNINLKSSFYNFWVNEKIIRHNIIKPLKNVNHTNFLDIMKNIKFSNDNYLSIIEKHSKKKDSFLFLDPPYLFSNNKSYQSQSTNSDMTNMIYEIYEIMKDKKTKSKIMMIINDLKILRWLFKDFVKGDYEKKYGISQKIEKHLIICNY